MTPQQQAAQEAASFVTRLNDAILFPLIALLSGVALLFLLYGCAEYIMNASNDQAREQGKKHITYGIVGLLVMVSAYSVLTLATGTFGLDQQLDCADDPSGSGCGSAFQLP
jgi:uncharacterized membrane protein YidH (DUF202 family)